MSGITEEDVQLSGRDLNKIAEAVKAKLHALESIDESILLLPAAQQRERLQQHYVQQQITSFDIRHIIEDRAFGLLRRKLEQFQEDVRATRRELKRDLAARVQELEENFDLYVRQEALMHKIHLLGKIQAEQETRQLRSTNSVSENALSSP
jgi:type I site-specific restriction endonuclease